MTFDAQVKGKCSVNPDLREKGIAVEKFRVELRIAAARSVIMGEIERGRHPSSI
jgi:hypothetical protein